MCDNKFNIEKYTDDFLEKEKEHIKNRKIENDFDWLKNNSSIIFNDFDILNNLNTIQPQTLKKKRKRKT